MIRVPGYFWSVSLQTYQLRALESLVAAAGALEPVVLVGGVVDHELGDHPQAAFLGLLDEAPEILHRPEIGIDVAIVGDVVAVVASGRGIEWQQPQSGDAEILQVAEFFGQPGEIADAVIVAVGKRLDVQLIDNGILVPELIAGFGGDKSFFIDGRHHIHGVFPHARRRSRAEERSTESICPDGSRPPPVSGKTCAIWKVRPALSTV